MTRLPKKTRSHLKFVQSCLGARKALNTASQLIEARRYEDGSALSPDELRLKCGSALAWMAKAEEELSAARVALGKELEHRQFEADPETIRRHALEADVKRLQSQRQRPTGEELVKQVLHLRRDVGMIPAAIADALKVSEFKVKQILRNAA